MRARRTGERERAMFELLFLVVFLASVVTLAAIIRAVVQGRRQSAVKLLAGYATGAALYLGTVVAVSLGSPQRVLTIGEDRCFDDWCIAVDNVTVTRELGPGERATKANGVFYVVSLRLSNRARGRAQRASSAAVHLMDGRGRRYEYSGPGQEAFEAQDGPAAPLTATIPVGQFLTTVQVFDLPTDAQDVSLTVEHPVGLSPGLLIIQDEASLFHQPTIVRLN